MDANRPSVNGVDSFSDGEFIISRTCCKTAWWRLSTLSCENCKTSKPLTQCSGCEKAHNFGLGNHGVELVWSVAKRVIQMLVAEERH
jgi:hypothetical protein